MSDRNHPDPRTPRPELPVLQTHAERLAPPAEVSRRGFLQLMGASAALALGATGCDRKPRRTIVSRVSAPEFQKPGQALHYASTWTDGPLPYGILVKTVDGRPVKIDGNPEHPVARGASTAAMQAMILGLYDPDRLQKPALEGGEVSWEEADAHVARALREARKVLLLTRSQLGPSERALIGTLRELVPGLQHLVHELVHDAPRRSAWAKLYGSDGEVVPDLARAKVILSLDSDFLAHDGAVLANIRGFAAGKRVDDANAPASDPSRLYVVESTMTLTGSKADHRLRLRPSAVPALLAALEGGGDALRRLAGTHGLDPRLLEALHADLLAHPGQALVVAGPRFPEAVHAQVARLNERIGAHTSLLRWDPEPATLPVTPPEAIEAAAAEADLVLVLGTNPVEDGLKIDGKRSVVHAALPTATAMAASVRLPSCHNLESWNDRRWGQAGESLCQPVIAPLFESRQEAESLLRWTQAVAPEGHPVKGFEDWHVYLAHRFNGGDPTPESQAQWFDTLKLGGRFAPGLQPLPPRSGDLPATVASTASSGLEAVILPHSGLYDGRGANNAWLQELPDPVSKVVWGGVAAVGVATARRLELAEGDEVELKLGDHTVRLPVLVQPGNADGVVALTLGHGQSGGGVAREAGGTNVAPLLASLRGFAPSWAGALQLKRTGEGERPVRTQETFDLHHRPIAIDGTVEQFRTDPRFVDHARHVPEAVRQYPPKDYAQGNKWGMSIDLNACVGCNACMAACQSENNIAVVGRDDCSVGRDMHWIRVDRYEEVGEDPDDVTVHQQPMLCQHCDDAPCENVCPVKATTHSPEGLNEMAYNRCVGTRYCSNNCPYKVRRFNYRRYQEKRTSTPLLELVHNPQVTVRGVGVMEKCTFCVQRIQGAKYTAKNEGRPLQDGDVQTACQVACPAQAIHFGDVNDAGSEVAQKKSGPRGYHVLEELNVNPNVTYLAQLRNPSPSVPGDEGGEEH
ncbi:MAG: 4Fe-4S dicluster domain-containing protein [Deltaproteobacteria bacterium]|nr:4Fe-4S dicluster domain-containing protein [Deltaproteobacteria bacterium]